MKTKHYALFILFLTSFVGLSQNEPVQKKVHLFFWDINPSEIVQGNEFDYEINVLPRRSLLDGTEEISLNVFLSEDRYWDENDVLVDSQEVPSNLSYRQSRFSGSAVVPEDFNIERNYVIFTAQIAGEVKPDNVSSPISINVLLKPRPELALKQLEASSTELFRNDSLSVKASISNNSKVDISENFDVAFILDDDGDLNNGFIELGSETIVGLANNQSQLLEKEFLISSEISSGAYHLKAVVDVDNVVNELSEFLGTTDDNSKEIDLNVFPDIDLFVSEAVIGSFSDVVETHDIRKGERFEMEFNVENSGADQSSVFRYKVFFSQDDILDESDTEIHSANNNICNFCFFGFRSINNVKIPLEAELGEGYLLIALDTNNLYNERNEENNTFSLPINVLPPPDVDLVITSAEIPDVWVVGDNNLINFTLINNGTEDAGSRIPVDIYVSTDENFNREEDQFLATRTLFSTASGEQAFNYLGGESYSFEENFVIVDNGNLPVSEDLYLFVFIDSNESIDEKNEVNNAYLFENKIQIKQKEYDIEVVSAILPDGDLVIGTISEISVELKNSSIEDNIPAGLLAGIIITPEADLDAYYDSEKHFLIAYQNIGQTQTSFGGISGPELFIQGEEWAPGDSVSFESMSILLNEGFTENELTPGTYNVFFVANLVKFSEETNTGNNIVFLGERTLRNSEYDLDITQASVSQDLIISNSSNNKINFEITNNGPDNSPSLIYLDIYHSEDENFDIYEDDAVGYLVDEDYIELPEIQGGSTLSVSDTNFTTESDIESGYFFLVIVDYNDLEDYDDLANNSKSFPLGFIEVRDPQQDLAIIDASVNEEEDKLIIDFEVDDLIDESQRISNIYHGIYLSTDNNLDEEDELLGTVRTFSISANTTRSQNFEYEGVSDLEDGIYYFIIVTDYENTVTEINEENNTIVIPYSKGMQTVILDPSTHIVDTIRTAEGIVTPNPVINELEIVTDVDITNAQYKIIILSGTTAQQGIVENSKINVSNLPVGMYYLSLHTQEGYWIVISFVKE